ncbi:MAG: DUF1152 domain-containing protein [Myxococcota bacterium]
MDTLQVPSPLREVRRVMVSGAGGGFDVFAGLPLAAALRNAGKEVVLANLSFTDLGATDGARLAPAVVTVRPDTDGPGEYFPGRHLAAWMQLQGWEPEVYAFEKVGVAPLREAWRALIAHHRCDAVVLVDGGTDILMRGDEAGLGTPEEDMASLAAVAGLDVPCRLVCCVGFGIDAHHGVCHAHFLENVAALARAGGYLGAQALVPAMPEVQAYLDAVAFAEARSKERESIVNASLASAVEGHFGDYHRTRRTQGGVLFINPLMSFLWAFQLDAVARRSLYLSSLEGTQSIWDVAARIEAFRNATPCRPYTSIPH